MWVWRRVFQLSLLLSCGAVRPTCCVAAGEVNGRAVRDMDATQLTGTYWNINPGTGGASGCPDGVRVGRVEILQSDSGVLYILPHRFISLPLEGGGSTSCDANPIDSSIATESATVLRRDTQTQLDRNDSLINEFALADERFFVGVELGTRTCGLTSLASDTVSLWMSPERQISVPFPDTGLSLTYQPGSKYVYYYTDPPCVFKGDARERGVVTPAPSTSNSQTPAPSQSQVPPPSPGGPSASDGATTSATLGGTPSDGAPSGASPFVPGPVEIAVSPVPGLSNSSGPVCFPGLATVYVYDNVHTNGLRNASQSNCGQSLPIKLLKIGHVVAAGINGETDTVIGFTHASPYERTRMVQLTTQDNRTLVASSGHFVYVERVHCTAYGTACSSSENRDGTSESSLDGMNKAQCWQTKKAEAVQVGDRLIDAKNGVPKFVTKTQFVHEEGLYNPQTLSGNLVVNGFVVTTFTTAVRTSQTGHALMTPWRLWHRIRYLYTTRSSTLCRSHP